MSGKNLIKKLKISLLGISTISSILFSCSNNPKLEKNNEIVHKILQIEENTDNLPFNTCPSLQTLDSLIDNSKEYIEKKEFYTEKDLEKISKKIYSEINKLNNLKNIKDQCYRSSLIYLAIGNANQIPFNIIDIPGAPGHIFIRYNPDGKHDIINPDNPLNKGDINIETTTGEIQESKNGEYSDNYYIHEFALEKESLKKNIFLRSLNEKELLSTAYTQIAINYLQKIIKNQNSGKNDFWRKKTIENCNTAIKLDSTSQDAYITLGMGESMEDKFPIAYEGHKKAIKSFEKALELYPSENVYYLIGNSYANLGHKREAIENYTKAINSVYQLREEFNKPSDYLENLEMRCLFLRAKMYGELGDKEKAEKDIKKLNSSLFYYKQIFHNQQFYK